jgi:Zn finger protein HypA/HybF involved in hydrogenase expression
MENYIKENEEYQVACGCNDCNEKFGIRVLKRDLDARNIKCTVCESDNIEVFSSNQVRQILME